ncbi:MAG: hypothetical protein ACRCS8_05515 [Brevinema sp.]
MKNILFVILSLFMMISCTYKDKDTLGSLIQDELSSLSVDLKEVDLDNTDKESSQFITALKKGDYSVLDEYFDTNNLSPSIVLEKSKIDLYNWAEHKKRKYSVADFSFSNEGKVLAYTNQYGIIFINDQEELISLEEVNTISNANCLGFSYIIANSREHTTPRDLREFFDENVYDYSSLSIGYRSFQNLLIALDIHSQIDFDQLDLYAIHAYISEKLEGLQSRTAVFNHLVFEMYFSLYDNKPRNTIYIPMHIEVHYAPGAAFCDYDEE